MDDKFDSLIEHLRELESVLVAFSGGIDSTFLLYCSLQALPKKNVLPVIVNSLFFPRREYEEAVNIAEKLDVKPKTIKANIISESQIIQNDRNRCYYCKYKILSLLKKEADKNNIKHVIEGSNADDTFDFRPGQKAVRELNVLSPLHYNGFTKDDIRNYSYKFRLPNWNKPASACLASRIPYGTTISEYNIKQVESAEEVLSSLGISNFRVRNHSPIARIEMAPDKWETLMNPEIRNKIINSFYSIGFKYITLDLQGYQKGSLNKLLK